MFETLTEKLQRAFKNLRGQGKLTEEHLDSALGEIREALLEGDVNVGVVDELIAHIRERALGAEVLLTLSPDQQVVKIVRDELSILLGREAKMQFASRPPSVWLVVGLQGSGKTTTTGKLGKWRGSMGTGRLWFRRTFTGRRRASSWRKWRRLRGRRFGRGVGPISRWRSCAERCARRSFRHTTSYWWIPRGACTLTMS